MRRAARAEQPRPCVPGRPAWPGWQAVAPQWRQERQEGRPTCLIPTRASAIHSPQGPTAAPHRPGAQRTRAAAAPSTLRRERAARAPPPSRVPIRCLQSQEHSEAHAEGMSRVAAEPASWEAPRRGRRGRGSLQAWRHCGAQAAVARLLRLESHRARGREGVPSRRWLSLLLPARRVWPCCRAQLSRVEAAATRVEAPEALLQ